MDGILDPIIFVMQYVMAFFYDVTVTIGFPNYGVAIILLTIVIKMALYPLTVKQVKSMKAMQDIAPKVKALQEKYKGNKEKINQEIAALYKQSGVNPLAGCLPILIQMPFLIAIFYALREFNYVSNPSFLWIGDLAQSSPSDPYYIIPLLAAATTYYMSKQTSSPAGGGDMMAQQAKMMMWMMPLFIGYMTHTFPAGLGLYWVVSNIIQIAQQWWVTRSVSMQGGNA